MPCPGGSCKIEEDDINFKSPKLIVRSILLGIAAIIIAGGIIAYYLS